MNLRLSIAMGDYDRNRALYDGAVQIDGVDPVFMLLNPEEMFFRAFRSVDFDVSELSFSSYLVKHAKGECPYIALPIFLSRASAHRDVCAQGPHQDTGRSARQEDRRPGIPADRQCVGAVDPGR